MHVLSSMSIMSRLLSGVSPWSSRTRRLVPPADCRDRFIFNCLGCEVPRWVLPVVFKLVGINLLFSMSASYALALSKHCRAGFLPRYGSLAVHT